MKQPKIKITGVDGKDWGIFDVLSLKWVSGYLYSIGVDFLRDGGDSGDILYLYLDLKTMSKFYDSTGTNKNFVGELIHEN